MTNQSKWMAKRSKVGCRVAGPGVSNSWGFLQHESKLSEISFKNCKMIDTRHKEADCALRIRNSEIVPKEVLGSLNSDAELSWDELTNCSHTFSETSSVVVLHHGEIMPTIPKTIVQAEAVRPAQETLSSSEFSRVGSPQTSVQLSWEVESAMDTLPHTNKIIVTSSSFRLPWSLEAVIRPESPSLGWSNLAERYYDYCWPAMKTSQPHYKSGTYPTISPLSVAIMSDEYAEEDYADDPSEWADRGGSVVAKTVRLPVSIASDMLIFIFKLIWPGKQQRPSDYAVHARSEGVTQKAVFVEGSA